MTAAANRARRSVRRRLWAASVREAAVSRPADTVAPERTGFRRGDGKGMRTAVILFGWSMLYGLTHLYWAVGGDFGLFGLKPSVPEEDIWVAANLFAFGLMAFAGLLGFGLEATRRRRKTRLLVLAIVGAGAAIATSHAIYGLLFRASQVAGVTQIDGQAFDFSVHEWVLWDMLAIEPWFLVEGLLLGLAGYYAQGSQAGRAAWTRLMGVGFVIALATGVLGLKVG